VLRFGRKDANPSVVTLADQARDQGQWERAAELYREALRRNPDNAPIWVQYGHMLKESGQLGRAETAYRRSIEIDDDSADSHLQLGHVLKLQGKRDEAAAAYLRAIAIDRSLADACSELTALGWSKEKLSQLQVDAPVGDAATRPVRIGASNRRAPGSVSRRKKVSVITRADRAKELGQWELAVRLYRRVLGRNPCNPAIWIQYGHVLKEAGRLAEAETAYRSAVTYNKRDADPEMHLGHVLKLQGRKKEAQAAYLRAFALDPSLDGALREFAQFGWSEAHFSELRRMLGADIAEHVSCPSEIRELQPLSRIAVVLHLYYPALWIEMRDAIARIPEPFDLFVSVVRGASEQLKTIVTQAFPNARVFEVENRGRDIGPFLFLLQTGVLFQYDLVCKLHTKRSSHMASFLAQGLARHDGDGWRRELVNGVLGSPQQISQIISSFRLYPDIGLVVADGNIYRGHEFWVANEELLAKLLPRLGISPDVRDRSFPGGSIFWTRSSLLRKLSGAGLSLEDFEPEPAKVDGGLAHAVERMFGLICESEGMRVVESGRLAELAQQASRTSVGITSESPQLIRTRSKLQDEIRIIRDSGLFDETYYLDQNPDVAQTGADPLLHFLEHGGFEDRNPHPLMHVSFYLRRYPDVASSGVNPAIHYVLTGAREQRICNPAGHSPFDNYGLMPAETPDIAGVKESFLNNPLISVVMPVYATRQDHERVVIEAIRSVQGQTYVNWELCICDDGSTYRPALRAVGELRQNDSRIRFVVFEANQGISAATNAAIRLAEGEFVALMDHDDMLAPNALYEVVKAINRYPTVDVLYTDQDKIDINNNRTEPFYKPSWSPELFRGVMFVGHLLVVRRSLLARLGGLDVRFDKVQDFELMLRLSETTPYIVHIPKILYHWRMMPDSVASGINAKSGIEERQVAAVIAHLERLGVRAKAITNTDWPHRVKVLPDGLRKRPKVSIIIPSKDAPDYIGRCLETVFGRTSYENYEVVVVDNGSRDPRALEILRSHPIIHCPFDRPFNFSRANNFGVARSSGEYLVLLNNDTEVISPDWLENLLFHFLEYDDVGIVGPLLSYPDGRVQHAGVVLGLRGTADHIMRFFPENADGYAGSLSCTREVSAVTAACLMMPRHLFDEIGGFTEEFATHYQDVDLCLRVRKKGLRVLFTPHSRLRHFESASRGGFYDYLDRDLILDVWGDVIAQGDPYYNVNFDRNFCDYTAHNRYFPS
jgi:O-antigen biosynthesis protein